MPIYKKEDPRKPESYRPVSLLTHARNVIESDIAAKYSGKIAVRRMAVRFENRDWHGSCNNSAYTGCKTHTYHGCIKTKIGIRLGAKRQTARRSEVNPGHQYDEHDKLCTTTSHGHYGKSQVWNNGNSRVRPMSRVALKPNIIQHVHGHHTSMDKR